MLKYPTLTRKVAVKTVCVVLKQQNKTVNSQHTINSENATLPLPSSISTSGATIPSAAFNTWLTPSEIDHQCLEIACVNS